MIETVITISLQADAIIVYRIMGDQEALGTVNIRPIGAGSLGMGRDFEPAFFHDTPDNCGWCKSEIDGRSFVEKFWPRSKAAGTDQPDNWIRRPIPQNRRIFWSHSEFFTVKADYLS